MTQEFSRQSAWRGRRVKYCRDTCVVDAGLVVIQRSHQLSVQLRRKRGGRGTRGEQAVQRGKT